jgi:hypothetical protein
LDGFDHITMRPTENIHDFIGRLIKVNSIILDKYRSYTITPPEPIPDANGNVSLVAMRAHNEALVENIGEFYLLNQFRAALPYICRVINLLCNPCKLWIWIRQSGWPPSSSTPKMRPGLHPASKPFKKKMVLRPFLRTVRKSSHHLLNKIKANRIARTTAHKITTRTITSSNGDQTWETTPTGKRFYRIHFFKNLIFQLFFCKLTEK